jgi:hypothetical protein
MLALPHTAQMQSPPAEDGPIKAEQFYKNLQVFKGMPAEQLMPAMYFFSSALGVDCGYCHKGEDRISDVPMKTIARRMIQMTAAINNASFNGGASVSCHTCHRGSTHPPSALPADDTAHFPRVAMAPTHGSQVGAMPSATDVIGRYASTLGGSGTLAALATMTATGTATDIDGRSVPLEVLVRPQSRLVLRQRPQNPIPVSYSGKTGWLVDYANHLRQMRLDEVDGAILEDGVFFPDRLLAVLTERRVAGLEMLDGREVYVVSGRTAYLPLVKLAFDKESGLLRRLEYYTEAGVGRFPVQFDVEKYSTVNGAQIPTRWIVTEIRRRRWTYQLDDIKPNAAAPDARFVMPADHTH